MEKLNSVSLDLLYFNALSQYLLEDLDKTTEASITAKIEHVDKIIKRRNPRYMGSDMNLLDVYTTRHEYDKFLQCIENLKHYVGDDPYFKVLEGFLYLQDENKDIPKALQCIKEAESKGLQSRFVLVLYYNLLSAEDTKDSKKEAQRIYNKGSQLFGDRFKNSVGDPNNNQ